MPNDEFSKKTMELKMAVNAFVTSYKNESNAIVSNISSMTIIISELEKLWVQYNTSLYNKDIEKCLTKIRVKVKFLRDHIADSIAARGSDSRMIDKYGENQEYVERKVMALYNEIPKEARIVQEPEQIEFDFDAQQEVPQKDDSSLKSEKFIKAINELRASITGFMTSYNDPDSVTGYISGMELTAKTIDALWRRYMTIPYNEQILYGIMNSIKCSIHSLESQCAMAELVAGYNGTGVKYSDNESYIRKKVDGLSRAFPSELRKKP